MVLNSIRDLLFPNPTILHIGFHSLLKYFFRPFPVHTKIKHLNFLQKCGLPPCTKCNIHLNAGDIRLYKLHFKSVIPAPMDKFDSEYNWFIVRHSSQWIICIAEVQNHELQPALDSHPQILCHTVKIHVTWGKQEVGG